MASGFTFVTVAAYIPKRIQVRLGPVVTLIDRECHQRQKNTGLPGFARVAMAMKRFGTDVIEGSQRWVAGVSQALNRQSRT